MGSGTIVINGDLGSGKSAVSVQLAGRLKLRRVAFGDVFREMASERRVSALELNQRAHRDDTIDDRVDELQQELAESDESVIVDSRLGWHFFADAFKVHLVVEPAIGAGRVMARPATATESYGSLADAAANLQARSQSERVRFLARYGVDKDRLRSYSLICDTSRLSAREVAGIVVDATTGRLAPETLADNPPLLVLDPARVYATEEVEVLGLRDLLGSEFVTQIGRLGPGRLEPLDIGYSDKCFYVMSSDGHRMLSASLRNEFPFVLGGLVGEGRESIVDGMSSNQYFRSHVRVSTIHDWDAAHGLQLALPTHVVEEVRSSRRGT
jgi:CMP/dCMP kinase